MRGGRASMWDTPFVLPEQKCCFLLCSGNRNSKLVIFSRYSERCPAEIAENGRDALVACGLSVDLSGYVRFRPVGEKLKCADAVATDGRQQTVCVVTFRFDALR